MNGKSRLELFLEATKILIWPLLVVVAAIWLNDEIVEIVDTLKTRSVKIGLIEVGERIGDFEDTLQDKLIIQKDYLEKIRDNPSDTNKVKEYATSALKSIESTQEGVANDLKIIKETIPDKKQSSTSQSQVTLTRPITAKEWEHEGFKMLSDKDITKSIIAFTESEKLWPDYHNVREIRQLLVERKEILKDKTDSRWIETYKIILEKYSWGMPSEIRIKFKEQVGEER